MTIIDRCTRWVECYLIKSLEPKELIQNLKKWCKHNPKPDTLFSDQGKNYMSKEFNAFLESEQIKHVVTTTYNPTGNSISERINQTISRVLQVSQRMKLKEVLKKLNTTLQNMTHRVLEASPHEIVKLKSIFDPKEEILEGFTPDIAKQIVRANQKSIERINMKRNNHNFEIGDSVYKKILRRTKLFPQWSGPYQIKSMNQDKTVMLISNEGHEEKINIKAIRPLGDQDIRPRL